MMSSPTPMGVYDGHLRIGEITDNGPGRIRAVDIEASGRRVDLGFYPTRETPCGRYRRGMPADRNHLVQHEGRPPQLAASIVSAFGMADGIGTNSSSAFWPPKRSATLFSQASFWRPGRFLFVQKLV